MASFSLDRKAPVEVVLQLKDRQFLCDRHLLSSNSAYFYAMFNNDFKEKHQENIELMGVEPEAFHFIVNKLKDISKDFTECKDVLGVLEVSCMLQFESIKKDCIQFIIQSWLSKDTWLPTANIADKLGLSELKCKAKTLALWNFSEVRKTEHFLRLSLQEVLEYLTDDTLRVTDGEFEVFEANVNWIEFNLDERLVYSVQLLSAVRFKNMQLFDIKNMLHFSIIKDFLEAELLIKCILEMKNSILNPSCKSCNQSTCVSQENSESDQSSLSDTIVSKSKCMRITQQCTCTYFKSSTVNTAKELLQKEGRIIPLIPCVVASMPLNKFMPLESPHKKYRKKNKVPYIFGWNGVKLLPYIHLSKIDEAPSEALGYKIVVKDLNLYIVGGEYMMGQGDWNNSIWFFDTWRECWRFETSLPSPRRHHSAVCINSDIYVIGGVGRHRVILDSMAKYNLVSKCWENCAPLPTPLYSTACCVYKGDIYLFGPEVFCYRQSVTCWEVISRVSLPGNTAVSVATADGENIYIIGVDAKLYSFVPTAAEIKVEFLGKFKTPGGNACLINNLIYYFAEEEEFQSIEIFNVKTKDFITAWYHEKIGESDQQEFCLHHVAGCFPFPKYY